MLVHSIKQTSVKQQLKVCTNLALTSFTTQQAELELVSSQKRKPEKADPDRKVWVIGVDKDQYDEGKVPGTKQSVTLTSMIKKVDTAVQDLTTKAKEGKFLVAKSSRTV